ncbi:MAG: efflux RND transporter periplasmic adaptor subunit [Burkholderiales bacterium]|nr:efflux RND transporter periplasmic adaptor subunit [Ferrovum sp.]
MNPSEKPNASPSDTSPRHRLSHAFKPLAIVIGLLSVLVLVGLINRYGLTNNAPRPTVTPTPTVAFVMATRGKPESELVLPGTLQPARETQIYARASGYVTKWHVDIGAEVHEGQLLLTIDSPEVDQNLAHAEAALASARANFQIATITLRRSKELLSKKFLSQQIVDEQEAQMQARAADVHANEADVRRYRESQAFERVTAPFSGRITYRNVEKGQLVTANSTDPNGWLYRLSATNPLRLFVNVPQSQARFIHDDMPVYLKLSEYPGRNFMAHVARSAGALDPSSKTLLTEVHIPNNQHELASGSYAEAHFTLKLDNPVIILPANTLIVRADGTKVAVIDQSNHIRLKPVTTGRDFGTTIEIITGLNENEKVVTNPSDSIRDGVTVNPVTAKVN